MSAQFGHANKEPIEEPDLDKRAEDAGADYEVNLESLSQTQLAWRKFKRHRLALIGLGILAFMFVVAIVGPVPDAVRFDAIPRPTRSSTRAAGRRSSTRSARPAASSATSSCSSSTERGRRSSSASRAWRSACSSARSSGPIAGLRRRLPRQPADADRGRHAEPAGPVRDPDLQPVLRRRERRDDRDHHLRPLQLDGRQPPGPEPVPVDPRT